MNDFIKYKQEPLVSIITTTYNRAPYLSQCINSVLNQSHKNIEYIILNDGSTDSTTELLNTFKDSRLKILNYEKNEGINLRLTHAFNIAKGEYVGVVDSDDFIERTCIEDCLANIGSAGMIYTQCSYFGDKYGIVPMCNYKYSKEALLSIFMTFHFRLFRTSLWSQIKTLSPTTNAWDYDLSLRLSEITNIIHIKKPLYNWRIHKGNIHKNKDQIRKDLKIIKNNAKLRRGLNLE